MEKEVRPALVTEERARRYLGDVSRAMLYKLRSEGIIHPVHLGRACRYRLDDLDEAVKWFSDSQRA